MIENYELMLRKNNKLIAKRFNIFFFFLFITIVGIVRYKSGLDEKGLIKFCVCTAVFLIIVFATNKNYKGRSPLFGGYFLLVLFYSGKIENFSIHVFSFSILIIAGVVSRWIETKKYKLTFTQENITYNTLPAKRLIAWGAMNNVILKDGLLTLDFKNDHIIQEEVLDAATDVTAFNHFAKEKVEGATKKNPHTNME